MDTSPFHRPLPLDAASAAQWDLASTQAVDEHAAWLRLRGFVAALLATWPTGQAWGVLKINPLWPHQQTEPLTTCAFGKGDSETTTARNALKRKGLPRSRVEDRLLAPSVMAWLSPAPEFKAQFEQLFFEQHARPPQTMREHEDRMNHYLVHTPKTLAAFLALPLSEWTRVRSTRTAIEQSPLPAAAPEAGVSMPAPPRSPRP